MAAGDDSVEQRCARIRGRLQWILSQLEPADGSPLPLKAPARGSGAELEAQRRTLDAQRRGELERIRAAHATELAEMRAELTAARESGRSSTDVAALRSELAAERKARAAAQAAYEEARTPDRREASNGEAQQEAQMQSEATALRERLALCERALQLSRSALAEALPHLPQTRSADAAIAAADSVLGSGQQDGAVMGTARAETTPPPLPPRGRASSSLASHAQANGDSPTSPSPLGRVRQVSSVTPEGRSAIAASPLPPAPPVARPRLRAVHYAYTHPGGSKPLGSKNQDTYFVLQERTQLHPGCPSRHFDPRASAARAHARPSTRSRAPHQSRYTTTTLPVPSPSPLLPSLPPPPSPLQMDEHNIAWAVFDGHGSDNGTQVARVASLCVRDFLAAHWVRLRSDPEAAFKDAFQEAQEAIRADLLATQPGLVEREGVLYGTYVEEDGAEVEEAADGGTTATVICLLDGSTLVHAQVLEGGKRCGSEGWLYLGGESRHGALATHALAKGGASHCNCTAAHPGLQQSALGDACTRALFSCRDKTRAPLFCRHRLAPSSFVTGVVTRPAPFPFVATRFAPLCSGGRFVCAAGWDASGGRGAGDHLRGADTRALGHARGRVRTGEGPKMPPLARAGQQATRASLCVQGGATDEEESRHPLE
jgi:hypothetical protein